jgi:hypothetical protein
VARSEPIDRIILHPTTYTADFNDYLLNFRISVIGPAVDHSRPTSVPLIDTAVTVRREIEAVLADVDGKSK